MVYRCLMLRSRRQGAQRGTCAAGLCSLHAIAVVVLVSSCSSDGLDPGDANVETVIVVPATATVTVGASFTLEAEARDVNNVVVPNRRAFWSAEDPAVAFVTEAGRVTARRVGRMKVAASIEGRSGLSTVTVTTVPVASVSVSPTNATLLVGDEKSFTARVRDPAGAVLANRPVAWVSSSPAVASVNSLGQVVALAPGSTIISAESEGRSDLAAVNVSSVPVASVRISPASTSLITGQSTQLQAATLDDANNPLPGRQVLWFSGNASVATVSPDGYVTAVTPGSATIGATSEGRTATAQVSVVLPRQSTVAVSPASATIGVLEVMQLSAELRDQQGKVVDNASFTWTSTDTRVATVTNKGKVTGRFPGTVSIRARSGSITGSATITVKIIG